MIFFWPTIIDLHLIFFLYIFVKDCNSGRSVGSRISYGGMSSAYMVMTYKHNIDFSHAAGKGQADGKRMLVNFDFEVDGELRIEDAEKIMHEQMNIILSKLNNTTRMFSSFVILFFVWMLWLTSSFLFCLPFHLFHVIYLVQEKPFRTGSHLKRKKNLKNLNNLNAKRNGIKRSKTSTRNKK